MWVGCACDSCDASCIHVPSRPPATVLVFVCFYFYLGLAFFFNGEKSYIWKLSGCLPMYCRARRLIIQPLLRPLLITSFICVSYDYEYAFLIKMTKVTFFLNYLVQLGNRLRVLSRLNPNSKQSWKPTVYMTSVIWSPNSSVLLQSRAERGKRWNGAYYGGQTYDGYSLPPHYPGMYAVPYGAYTFYGSQQQVNWEEYFLLILQRKVQVKLWP